MSPMLYNQLAAIGLNVSHEGEIPPFTDIETTLISALKHIPDDRRILGLLLSWIKCHGGKVNIERLSKLIGKDPPEWLGLLAAFAVFQKQHRWKKLLFRPKNLLANGSIESNKGRAKFKGEEEWAKGSGYLIPKGSESISEKYVLSPAQLAKVNRHYKNKLLYGANWRADIATAIEMGAENPYQAAKMCHCSYEPAHRVYKDFSAAGMLGRG